MSNPITPERVQRNKQSRFNPIRQLQPDRLAQQLDEFEAGNLRETALLWDIMERRDDILKCVAPKRKKAVARRPWEILTLDDSPAAQKQKAALEFFYNNLTATHALERNMTGGFQLLVRQMMDAVSKRYAVHYIQWKPSTEGLTADFQFVPLWFFENRTGQLRFLKEDFALDGEALDPNSWLITYGDGLMESCAIAYMFKHLSLKDWVIYNERHGMPGVQGKTRSAKGSEEWNNMTAAVAAIAADFACVTGLDDVIEKIDFSASGELPYPKLVDRMDRCLAAIWRGGDLSTLAKGDAVGANPQEGEGEILVEDDCQLISETLWKLDGMVLEHQLGVDHPLAYIQLTVPKSQDVKQDLEVDRFLVDAGAPLSIADALQRYGRPQPKPEDPLLTPVRPPSPDPGIQLPPFNGQNERRAMRLADDPTVGKFLAAARMRLAQAQADTLLPVRKALQAALEANDQDLSKALSALKTELPALLKKINAAPATVKIWEDIMGAAMADGLAGRPQTTNQNPK
jgi:phage gp29-like protein